MLSNVNADKDQFLQLILVGQPQLKDLLCAPQFVQFAQRVSADFHLKPLNCSEVTQYIDWRLHAVGARAPLFSPEACEVVAQASLGSRARSTFFATPHWCTVMLLRRSRSQKR